MARRANRTRFIGSLLEVYGFTVHVLDDTLVARMDNVEADYVQQRLRVLGYLIIHTRQLDLILDSDPVAAHHRERLLAELDRVKGSIQGIL